MTRPIVTPEVSTSQIAICICTFRRPKGLRKLLQSLGDLQTSRAVTIIVADNDAEGREGLATCDAVLAEGYRWPIRSFVVAERGLSSVRNAVVGAALDDADIAYFGMLDDDEYVVPGWLEAMLEIQAQTSAHVVDGPVQAVFERPSTWHDKSDVYYNGSQENGVVPRIYGTCNLMFSRRITDLIDAPFFDQRYSFTGGEDLDFLKRAEMKNAVFARAREAQAYETIPATRMTVSWALQRAYRIGATEILVARRLGMGYANWPRVLLKFPLFVGRGVVELVVFAASPSRRVNALRRIAREFGRLAGMSGRSYDEYRNVHGA